MAPINVLCLPLIAAGGFFYLAGTAGLMRFPDIYTRLHALTKADNLGLGLIVMGLVVRAESLWVAGELLLIWILVLVSGASVAHLVAHGALTRGIRPWGR